MLIYGKYISHMLVNSLVESYLSIVKLLIIAIDRQLCNHVDISLLVDWKNSGIFEDIWKSTLLKREVVKNSKRYSKITGTVENQKSRYSIRTRCVFSSIFSQCHSLVGQRYGLLNRRC